MTQSLGFVWANISQDSLKIRKGLDRLEYLVRPNKMLSSDEKRKVLFLEKHRCTGTRHLIPGLSVVLVAEEQPASKRSVTGGFQQKLNSHLSGII